MKQKTKIGAEVVADSLDTRGNRLTSFLITMPRIILSEINTHRMLSKNTSSSRAIPFNKMVESVQNDPFIPIAWQREHKGMQGSEYFTDHKDIDRLEDAWVLASKESIERATALTEFGLTKQLCNRLLEPFMWTTMLITGSKEGWDNFFKLRNPVYKWDNKIYKSFKDLSNEKGGSPEEFSHWNIIDKLKINKGQAEIHIMDLAEKIYDAMNESTPNQLKAGEWHIPFEDKINIEDLIIKNNYDNIDLWEEALNKDKVKISTAMAARTSYTVLGDEKEIDYNKMISLHDRLIAQDPPHSSPMEHCCLVVTEEEYNDSFKGREKGWFRNYKGFKSYRHLIETR
jgi:thymidylate synthase ThyX